MSSAARSATSGRSGSRRRHPVRVGRVVLLGAGPLVPEAGVPGIIRLIASPAGAADGAADEQSGARAHDAAQIGPRREPRRRADPRRVRRLARLGLARDDRCATSAAMVRADRRRRTRTGRDLTFDDGGARRHPDADAHGLRNRWTPSAPSTSGGTLVDAPAAGRARGPRRRRPHAVVRRADGRRRAGSALPLRLAAHLHHRVRRRRARRRPEPRIDGVEPPAVPVDRRRDVEVGS